MIADAVCAAVSPKVPAAGTVFNRSKRFFKAKCIIQADSLYNTTARKAEKAGSERLNFLGDLTIHAVFAFTEGIHWKQRNKIKPQLTVGQRTDRKLTAVCPLRH